MTPEARARQTIDALLMQAGWHVCNMGDANIHAARGVAFREFPLNPGYGFADYLLYIDGKDAGVIEAKKEGAIFTGVERLAVPLSPIAEQIRIVSAVELGAALNSANRDTNRAQCAPVPTAAFLVS